MTRDKLKARTRLQLPSTALKVCSNKITQQSLTNILVFARFTRLYLISCFCLFSDQANTEGPPVYFSVSGEIIQVSDVKGTVPRSEDTL